MYGSCYGNFIKDLIEAYRKLAKVLLVIAIVVYNILQNVGIRQGILILGLLAINLRLSRCFMNSERLVGF